MKTMYVQMKRMAFVLTACLFATTLMAQGVQEKRVNPGNKVAMKLYKGALKKEYKNRSYSMAVYKELAEDGYAPAQYKLYEMGQGEVWLEKAAFGGVQEAAEEVSHRLAAQCSGAVDRCRSCITRSSQGGLVSTKEVQMLQKDRGVFLQALEQVNAMKGNMDAAMIAKDFNYFSSDYKGKRVLYAVEPVMINMNIIREKFDEYAGLMMEIENIQRQKK